MEATSPRASGLSQRKKKTTNAFYELTLGVGPPPLPSSFCQKRNSRGAESDSAFERGNIKECADIFLNHWSKNGLYYFLLLLFGQKDLSKQQSYPRVLPRAMRPDPWGMCKQNRAMWQL